MYGDISAYQAVSNYSWSDDSNWSSYPGYGGGQGGGLSKSIWYAHSWQPGVSGNDTLYGEAGNDTLYGQCQDDTLDGGTGADTPIVHEIEPIILHIRDSEIYFSNLY